jgi:hypothetical protein
VDTAAVSTAVDVVLSRAGRHTTVKETPVRTFSIGDRVSQAQYGPGTITSVNEFHTVIDFDEHGSRTFSTAMVQLEKSSTTAPMRAKTTRRKTATRAAKA